MCQPYDKRALEVFSPPPPRPTSPSPPPPQALLSWWKGMASCQLFIRRQRLRPWAPLSSSGVRRGDAHQLQPLIKPRCTSVSLTTSGCRKRGPVNHQTTVFCLRTAVRLNPLFSATVILGCWDRKCRDVNRWVLTEDVSFRQKVPLCEPLGPHSGSRLLTESAAA